jgi:hypothetical protein
LVPIGLGPDQKSASVDIDIKASLDCTKAEPTIDVWTGPKTNVPLMWKVGSGITHKKKDFQKASVSVRAY